MAENTKAPLLKRSFSPGLEDEVTAIETKTARISGTVKIMDDRIIVKPCLFYSL